jgi:hypothetical protein
MSTVTVPRDVTSKEVVEALRNGLDARYEVLPGMKMPRSPLFGRPRPSEPELILVTSGPMVRAQVRLIPGAGRTDLQITPAGLLGDLLMNTLGIAREVRQALLNAPSLDARSERHRSR